MDAIGKRVLSKLDRVDGAKAANRSGDIELAEAMTILQRVSDSAVAKTIDVANVEVKLTGVKGHYNDGYEDKQYVATRLSLHRTRNDEIVMRLDYTPVAERPPFDGPRYELVSLSGRSTPHATNFYPDAPRSFTESVLAGSNTAETLRPFLADLLTQLEARIP